MDELVMQGFEIYILQDHKRARKLIERFPGSIMFINIDERLAEPEWEVYIREIQENPSINTRLGILSYNNDRVLMEKYLMEIMVPCGYVQLKQGVKESAVIIRDALLANEAKGRRKSFRAICEEGSGSMNFKSPLWSITGKILDISSAGFAAKMDHSHSLDKNSLMKKVQLKLRGALTMVDLIYLGPRYDNPDIWILLFDPTSVTDNAKITINHYIKLCLQRLIDTVEV
ncbi:MAG: PilZ domain-containing protein [Treponema sp.]|nr:PilZ domain-containing protein [Treponema sp.]